MLAGQPPFRGQSAFEVALQHVRAEPGPLSLMRPDLPPDLCRIIHKMMAKKPEERYQNCRELLHDLDRLREAPGAFGSQAGSPHTKTSAPEYNDSLAMSTATCPAANAEPATRTILTAPAKPTRRHTKRRGLLAAAILGALLTGAGAAWWRLHPLAGKTASPPAGGDVGEVNALFSESELEKFLTRAVDKYANPPEGDKNQIRLGVDHGTELLVFYLERHRLDEANRFLDRLDNPDQKVRPYKALGRLGRAIVLALQDRPKESNQLFLLLLKETKNERDRFLQLFWFTQNPSLRYWVARALDYNKENATPEHPFPIQLEFLRRPTVIPWRPGDKETRRQGDQETRRQGDKETKETR
jgi:serine/threonine-protein kinase